MPHTKWDERDHWRIPNNVEDSSIHWWDAPGVRMEARGYDEPFHPLPRPFWAIGENDGRWWANEDGTPEMFWFNTEQEAMAFVEVMIRMA